MNITDKFLDILHRTLEREIPSVIEEKLKICIADTVAAIIGGVQYLDKKDIALNSIIDGEGEIRPLGMTIRTSMPTTILLNGMNAHALEMDDGIKYGVIHPSAPILSALLPIAKYNNIQWRNFVKGALAAYETAIRIASSMQPSHYSCGYHPTATCCTLGVAVGIAVMLEYSQSEIKDALAAAVISASGTLKVIEGDSQLKPYNCGKAAMMGYYAAAIAKAGFNGDTDPLGGANGFINMMSTSFREDILTQENDFYYLEKIYQKPYASCRHTHPGIEAALRLRDSESFDIDNIKEIMIRTYSGVIGKHDGNDIHSESAAKMSIPYSVAVAFMTGKVGIEEFTNTYINNPTIQKLTKKTKVIGDEELTKLVPQIRSAIVTLTLNNGAVLEERINYPKGEPENPMSSEELFEKFETLTYGMILDKGKIEELYNSIITSGTPNFDRIYI